MYLFRTIDYFHEYFELKRRKFKGTIGAVVLTTFESVVEI